MEQCEWNWPFYFVLVGRNFFLEQWFLVTGPGTLGGFTLRDHFIFCLDIFLHLPPPSFNCINVPCTKISCAQHWKHFLLAKHNSCLALFVYMVISIMISVEFNIGMDLNNSNKSRKFNVLVWRVPLTLFLLNTSTCRNSVIKFSFCFYQIESQYLIQTILVYVHWCFTNQIFVCFLKKTWYNI